MSNIKTEKTKFDRRACLRGLVGATMGVAAGGRFFGDAAVSAEPLREDDKSSSMERVTLEQSLRLAGQNLLSILNPDENFLPYWEMAVSPDYKAGLKRGWPAHNLGRWFDAMLRLEEAIGFEIPKNVERAMTENVRLFFDNPDHICLAPLDKARACGGDTRWDLHSLREGLLALNALARWRKDGWAVEQGKLMIKSLDEKLRDDGSWDLEKFDVYRKRGGAVIHNLDRCDTHGRMLEALVWFFETTGELSAFRFAERLAEHHFAQTTTPDGTINPAAKADHTHSYLGTLRGLLLFGRLTRQSKFIDRVAAAYRVNVPRITTEAGYTSHNMAVESIGETTSPGDVAQLALWLFEQGHPDFIDDAERLVRARILPSQIRQTPPLHPAAEGDGDEYRDLEKRILGGYGGCHGHAHGGKRAVTDVTSADVHTLVDIYKHVAVKTGDAIEVLFHFDYEDSRIRSVCRRGEPAELSVMLKSDAMLAIRVPGWTPRNSVRVRLENDAYQPVFAGQFVWTGKLPAGTCVTVEYAIPEKQTKEKGLGTEFEVHWHGDEVTGVRPNTDFYPFYPEAPRQ
jgi:hypothetical protein